MGEFFGFARGEDPTYEVSEDTLGEIRQPAGEPFGITVTGTFAEDIDTAAHALAEQVSKGRFPRADVGGEQVIQRVGHTLYVDGLQALDEEKDHPLVAIVNELGAERALVEGDRYGEGAILVDVSARAPSSGAARKLAEELTDYWSLLYYMYARPPWHPVAISADESLARATFRALTAGDAPGPEAHAALASVYKKRPRFFASAAKLYRWGEQLGEFTGSIPGGPQDTALCASTGNVRERGDRIDVAWIGFTHFGAGFPAFLRHLWNRGCRDIRYDVIDFDQVRED